MAENTEATMMEPSAISLIQAVEINAGAEPVSTFAEAYRLYVRHRLKCRLYSLNALWWSPELTPYRHTDKMVDKLLNDFVVVPR
jgi:hypothetical protein